MDAKNERGTVEMPQFTIVQLLWDLEEDPDGNFQHIAQL